LRVRSYEVEVEVRDRLRRAEPALQRLHDVDLGIREERVQVIPSPAGLARDVVVAVPHSGRELHPVAARLPPLDAAEDVRAAVVRAGRGSDTDRAALGKRLPEASRGDQQTRTVCVARPSRPRTSDATAVRTCAPFRLPPD